MGKIKEGSFRVDQVNVDLGFIDISRSVCDDTLHGLFDHLV